MTWYLSLETASRLPFGLPASAALSATTETTTRATAEHFDAIAATIHDLALSQQQQQQQEQDAAVEVPADTVAKLISRAIEQHPLFSSLLRQDGASTNELETALCSWIFDSIDARFVGVFRQAVAATTSSATGPKSTAPLLAIALRACTALEILIRQVPGMSESDEGIGLLNQVVKSRMLGNNSSGNDNTEAREWSILLTLIRCCIVDGKGMHLRNLLWHGYVLPDSIGEQQTVAVRLGNDNSTPTAVFVPGSACLLACTIVVGTVVKLMAKCLPNFEGSAAVTWNRPDDWNAEIFFPGFMAMERHLRAVNQEASSSSSPFSAPSSSRLLHFLFSCVNGNSSNKEVSEVFVPVMLIAIESALRHHGAMLLLQEQIKTGISNSKPELLAVAVDDFFLNDTEDVLSWQGPAMQPANQPLRRGIQRIRDASDAFVAQFKLLQQQQQQQQTSAEVALPQPGDISQLPHNVLLSVLPIQLFAAWRALFLTLMPVGPRLRDMVAHGKLSAADAGHSFGSCVELLKLTLNCLSRHQQQPQPTLVVNTQLCVGTPSFFANFFVTRLQGAIAKLQSEIAAQLLQLKQELQEQQPQAEDGQMCVVEYSISQRNGMNKNIKATRYLYRVSCGENDNDDDDQEQGAAPGALAAYHELFPTLDSGSILSSSDVVRFVGEHAVVAPTVAVAQWIARDVDCAPFAIRSSLAIATNVSRLADAVANACEAALKKWGGKSRAPAAGAAAAAGSSAASPTTSKRKAKQEQPSPRETIPILQLIVALAEKVVAFIDDPDRYSALCVDPAKANNGKKNSKQQQQQQAHTAARCLMDVTLPFEGRFSRLFARNVPVIEQWATEPNLPGVGKLLLACLNWS